MNLIQLRFAREAVRQNFNLTEVANSVFISQPAVSRHIRELEDELGVELFERRGKRLTGLTPQGEQLVPLMERVLLAVHNLKKAAEEQSAQDRGRLVVATTHTQARYALPDVVRQFTRRYPKVQLCLHQGSPQQIADMVAEGEADLGMATEALEQHAELQALPAYRWQHCVLVPQDHALAGCAQLALNDLARHPLVTYDAAFGGRGQIDRAFAAAGLTPDVVLSAIDADVIKTYVEAGMGVGIVAHMAYDPERDRRLVRLEAGHLFGTNTARIALRRGAHLRDYAFDFVALVCREQSEQQLRAALARHEAAYA